MTGSGDSSGLRVGIVGAGVMGETHLDAWTADGVEARLFDVHPERAAALAERFGAGLAASLDKLVASVDVVDICTATHLHRDVTERAATAGRHVICEKPIARTVEDAERMIEVCRQAGVRLFVAHVVRFFPEYVAAEQAVRAGRIGTPAVLRLKRASFKPRRPAGSWFFDHAKSGGMILDLMVHDFDYVRWIAGDVVAVHCRAATVGGGELGVDHAYAVLTHERGAISHVTGSWAYPPPVFRTSLEIAGSAGLIEYDSEENRSIVPYRDPAGGGAGAAATADVGLPGSPLAESPFRLELREFRRAIVEESSTRVTAEDALAALRIALAADESARTGRVVRLDRVAS